MARKRAMTGLLAASVALAAIPTTAMAHDHYYSGWSQDDEDNYDDDGGVYSDYPDYSYGHDYYDNGYYGQDDSYYAGSGYDDGYYRQPRYRYRCHGSGTTGAIVGAIAGGLLGNGIAGYGDHALGTILGGGAGALAGRAVERSANDC